MKLNLATATSEELRELLKYLEQEVYFRYDEDKEKAVTHLRNLINTRDLDELLEDTVLQFNQREEG